jgi:hypothetical protein
VRVAVVPTRKRYGRCTQERQREDKAEDTHTGRAVYARHGAGAAR